MSLLPNYNAKDFNSRIMCIITYLVNCVTFKEDFLF